MERKEEKKEKGREMKGKERKEEEGKEEEWGSLALAVGRGSMRLASPSFRLTLMSTGLSTPGM